MAGVGAAVDPTPSQFRRKWGTDRHHLPRRRPKPQFRLGSQTRRPRAPRVECTPTPGNKKARCCPLEGGVPRAAVLASRGQRRQLEGRFAAWTVFKVTLCQRASSVAEMESVRSRLQDYDSLMA